MNASDATWLAPTAPLHFSSPQGAFLNGFAPRFAANTEDRTPAERVRLLELVEWVQGRSTGEGPVPEGFNLGVNDGPAAGQTMPQFHFHVIPRRRGDVPDPRGGIRWVVAEKARYW